MTHTALLEIGVEEIPANVVLPALDQLAELAAAGLERHRLQFGDICTFGTPRRLVIMIKDLADRQSDITREVKGPPVQQAFDASGKPTRAAEGFARGRGIEVSALQIRDTDKGRFVFAEVIEQGLPATEVLAQLWPEVIRKLTFPKTMRWGHVTMRFARPIRWIVALYGAAEVIFEIAKIRSGRSSRGHRFLHPTPLVINEADSYLEIMEKAYVLVDHRRRREIILEQAQTAAAAVGGRVRIDRDLLEEVSFLVEYPTCLCGTFPEQYLTLPEAVLVTVMTKHQRYFPVEDQSGKLLPRFVAVRNGNSRALEVVRAGNERVIVPRFADAAFYYAEDRKRRLGDRLADLERVTFLEQQGSLRAKTERIVCGTQVLCAELHIEPAEAEAATKAAQLSKCDLVTLMVQDLTSLQGIMGGEYARQEGLDEAVCQAIEDHYRPRFTGGELPRTQAGAIVSLADKLDNLAACFSLGLRPKGASDPWGLRRQAAGVVGILLQYRWRIDLPARLQEILASLPHREVPDEETLAVLLEFFGQRLDALLEGEGVAYDIRRAILSALGPDLLDAYERGLLLERARQKDAETFAKLTFAAARVGKIVRPALAQAALAINPGLFQSNIEFQLWETVEQSKAALAEILSSPGNRDYDRAWCVLQTLERPIWDYFDVETGVLVMAEDLSIRANRLATLRDVDQLFLRIADFTEIVVE
ncbi:MAG: glycine--tRNA ligase subunit beta [Candidatus Zipacnadales bacterium]